MSKFLAEQALAIAAGYIGEREQPPGSNRSPVIDGICKTVGVPVGSKYCAASVWVWAEKASAACGEKNPIPKTAGVAAMWARVPARYKTTKPRRGCVFIHISDKGDHCGLVTWVDDGTPGQLRTYEANTNPAGSRDGDGFYERTRPLDYPTGFIDLNIDDGPPTS